MIPTIFPSLAAVALLSMAAGGEAFGQSAKKNKRPLLQQHAIDGNPLANKAKVPLGSFAVRQRKQRLYPAAGCPQCTIKKD
jgi:hypothetical protein